MNKRRFLLYSLGLIFLFMAGGVYYVGVCCNVFTPLEQFVAVTIAIVDIVLSAWALDKVVENAENRALDKVLNAWEKSEEGSK